MNTKRHGKPLATGMIMGFLAALAGCATETQKAPASATGTTASAASGHSCSVPDSSPQGTCLGCSVNCGDRQAFCTIGQEFPGGSVQCVKSSVCECR
jgi:hypothetical protein